MTSNASHSEGKLMDMLMYAPVGLVEMDPTGRITLLNIKGEQILGPIIDTYNTGRESLLPILPHFDHTLIDKIANFKEPGGIISQEIYRVMMPTDSGPEERYFLVVANKQRDSTVMVSFDDFTERIAKENAMRQAEVDKAVEQGKFEIASGVLHDIGNAVVGFGSHLTRTRRMTEQNSLENLDNLVKFFTAQQDSFSTIIGNEKAQALVDILEGISKTQRDNYKEINRSITEQLNIITHIQEILNIQRQYVSGHESQERKPVSLKSIINDCMAMLFASLDKRGIVVSLNIPAELPVIKGDRTKLMQVMLNILKNSLEAIDMRAEQKNISIDLQTSATGVTVLIKDSGCGFDNATGARLFERNFTTKSTGTGLGLHNCKTIIESHAGSMSITSDGPGKGATTTIEFNLN
jgi:signal transduction histidine kinase